MNLKLLLQEAALEQPGFGMPEEVARMSMQGWVRAIDEHLEHDDTAWGIWFIILHHFLEAKDHLR